jgi:predicted GIY-YIG superfamily endonuclease
VYQVRIATLREAFILERKIKRLPRAGKEKLIVTAQTSS